MASKNMQNVFLSLSALLILLLAPRTESFPKPSSVFLPVRQDHATGAYLVDIPRTSPLKPVPLLIDLNAKFLSADCDVRHSYLSSAYHYPQCNSDPCSLTGVHFCRNCSLSGRPAGDKPVGCHNNTCFVLLINPLTNKTELGDVTQDSLAVRTLQGSIPGPLSILHDFIFTCAPSTFFQRLPENVRGFAGFSKDPVSLPNQIASRFGFAQGFSLCLSSRKNQNGGIFFGKSPYQTTPQKHTTYGRIYTPFLVGSKGEYLLPPVRTIQISQKAVKFNGSLSLKTPDQKSAWVTMISTTVPYTALQSIIFRAVTKAFIEEFSDMGASVATPVAPFGACFSKLPPPANEARFAAPVIDLMMQSKSQTVSWRVFGSNSLIEARKGKWCLAFVDGGISPRALVVLGAYQLQDHVLEFDLNRSRLGFSQTTGCPQFNL